MIEAILFHFGAGLGALLPEAKPVFIECFRRGYRLGILGAISSGDGLKLLRDAGISGYFETIQFSEYESGPVLSSTRLQAALTELDLAPERCALVCCELREPVVPPEASNFAQRIRLGGFTQAVGSPAEIPFQPDVNIDHLERLLDFFPAGSPEAGPVSAFQGAYPKPLNASLSTMWAIGQFDRLDDFFEAARRMGFATIELNHQVNPRMLEGIPLPPGRIRSVHEPCPAAIPVGLMEERDWLISSPDEAHRAEGVASIRRSIDLAERVGARVVVVHCGVVTTDHSLERQLQALILAGQPWSDEAQRLRQEMLAQRRQAAEPRLQAVQRSLCELLAYARRHGVCLGLENRDHFIQIPLPNEMEGLLELGDPENLGYVFDLGHASALDRMGFYPKNEWLRRFGHRLVGAHLHDGTGFRDHAAPGLGGFDFDAIRPVIPQQAFRTFEIAPWFTFHQVKCGLKYLEEKGFFQEVAG